MQNSPALIPSGTAGEEEEAVAFKERKERLTQNEKAALKSLLGKLTVRNADVRACMVFCLDHSFAAQECSQIILAAFEGVDSNDASRKVAFLYLISDLLFNSSAPARNAFMFRSIFSSKITSIIESFSVWMKLEGRLIEDMVRTRVKNILRAWEFFMLFSKDVLVEMRRFLRLEAGKKKVPNIELNQNIYKVAAKDEVNSVDLDIDGEPLDF